MGERTTVWVSPGATSYSCLCEHCLEGARVEGRSLFEALAWRERPRLDRRGQRCRVRALPGAARDRDPPRPAAPGLTPHDQGQLQLA